MTNFGDIFRFNPVIFVSVPVFSRIEDCSLFIIALLLIIDGKTHTTQRYKPIASSNKTLKVIVKIFFIQYILL